MKSLTKLSYYFFKKHLIGTMLSILICVPMYSQVPYTVPAIKTADDFGQVIYIDPSQSTNGDGTIENPFNSMANLTIQSNTAYLIKAGTVLNEAVKKVFDNNYVGKYGEGEKPIITASSTVLDLNNDSKNVTIDNLALTKVGNANYDQIIRLHDSGKEGIVLANLKVYGQDQGSGYPYYCMKGSAIGMVLYHCEFAYCSNDGWYAGQFENVQIVSNYFHHQNMGGVSATNSTGDGIQMENAMANNLYLANNYIDRSHTIWKFALIINSTLELSNGVVCEWNTFIAPKAGNGGAAVRWLAGTNNKFTKNLINTETGVTGIDGYDAHLNQTSPYGVRDNLCYGSGNICTQTLNDASNKKFNTKQDYLNYLDLNEITSYGSNIDPDNFWNQEPPVVVTNHKPVAKAGNNATVNANDAVTLDGSDSNDPDEDEITYDWTAPAGITLSSTTAVSPTFTAPETDEDKTYTFSLTVCDGELYSDVATVKITVKAIEETDPTPVDTTTPSVNEDAVLLEIGNVTASENDGNLPEYTLDKSLETRWSAEGDGQWICFELNNFDSLKYIKTAWYKGDLRVAYFDIQVSMDGSQWETISPNNTSCGQTSDLEVINIVNKKTKYVKFVGFGNTENAWNSITEVELYGTPYSEVIEEEKEKEEEEIETPTSVSVNRIETINPFPNPSTGNVNINLSQFNSVSGTLTIINIVGQKVFETEIMNNTGFYNISLNSYPNGIYILRYKDSNNAKLIGEGKIVLRK